MAFIEKPLQSYPIFMLIPQSPLKHMSGILLHHHWLGRAFVA